MNIEYQDYTNEWRIAKKQRLLKKAIVGILEEDMAYVRDNISLLEILAESVDIIEAEDI